MTKKSSIIDTHIHVGHFFDKYYSPSHISHLMADVGVDYYAVSSTTMCEENYERVLNELNRLIELDGEKVLPVMWISPDGLKGNIAWFLESEIQWRMIKIHPELHPEEWHPNGSLFNEVIDIVREMNLPLLIHTGEKECCHAKNYERLIGRNDDVTFVLAHGRPLSQTLELLTFDNVFVDSAFMPIDYMKTILENGFAHKLLWGTDMCIPQYYFPEISMTEYYLRKLNLFRTCCSEDIYNAVTFTNAQKLLGIDLNVRPNDRLCNT